MSTEATRNSDQKSGAVLRLNFSRTCGVYRLRFRVTKLWLSRWNRRKSVDADVPVTGGIIGALATSMHESLHVLQLAGRR